MPAEQISYSLPNLDSAEQMLRLRELRDEMDGRRTVRHFSDRPVPREVIEQILAVAHSAPSGANRKPWRFVAINDPDLKREVRIAAEAEEKQNYEHRFPPEWLEALEPFGTTWKKPFLETAPWLIVIFRVDWEEVDGQKRQNYYPVESTGIASGFLLLAAHRAGLATLTHTPNPMRFLRTICQRPVNEKPFLLIPVGYPADDCRVPDIAKKPLIQAIQWNLESPAHGGP